MAVGTTNFPTSLDTVVELVEVTNDASTQLNGALTSNATTITVDSTSLFPSSGIITIDSENISYTGKTGTTFTGCTRAAESTTAATHDDNATVELLITAALPTVHAAAIIAIETKLGSGASIDAAKIADGSISNTEFQYLNGVSSAIQTQLDAKQTAFGSQTANTVYAGPTSGGAASPSFRALVSGDLPTHNQAWSTITSTPTTLSGYGITDAQGLDSDLTAIAGLSPSNDDIIQRKAGAWTNRTPTQLTADLIAFTGDSGSGGVKGLVPAPAAGDAAASKYLKADGTWATAGGSSGITIGSTTITSGTTTRVLYNNSGVVGEYAVTGTGNAVLSASPTLTGTVAAAAATFSGTITQTSASATAFESGPNGGTNPVFRLVNSTASAATGLSITGNAAGSGVTLTALSSGTNEGINIAAKGSGNILLSTTGNIQFGGTTSSFAMFVYSGGRLFFNAADNSSQFSVSAKDFIAIPVSGNGGYGISSATGAYGINSDTFLGRGGAANFKLGGSVDVASPVAQTLSVQNVVAGTSNTAGANWTFAGSRGTGTGAGGRIIFQTAPAGSTGTSQNSLVEAVAVESSGTFKFKTLAFSALPTAVADGEAFYCSDGAVTSVADNTLASGGTGALAVRINGVWRAFNAQN